jgi:transcriptional regulator with XRE-family HTH domain
MQGMGRRLRELRERRGWTRVQLGVYADVSTATVSQAESGKRTPNAETLVKLASALGVEPGDFFLEPASPKADAPSPLDAEAKPSASDEAGRERLEQTTIAPYEGDERWDIASPAFDSFVDSLDDKQLLRFRKLQSDERVRLAMVHHDHPSNSVAKKEFLRAVARNQVLLLELVTRGYEHVEELAQENTEPGYEIRPEPGMHHIESVEHFGHPVETGERVRSALEEAGIDEAEIATVLRTLERK